MVMTAKSRAGWTRRGDEAMPSSYRRASRNKVQVVLDEQAHQSTTAHTVVNTCGQNTKDFIETVGASDNPTGLTTLSTITLLDCKCPRSAAESPEGH